MKRTKHTEGESKREREREREGEWNDEDRLSDLPDCVVLHILGFMNPKYAIRTSILSRRWKDLWKSIPTLRLHSEEFWTSEAFSNFVSRVLSLRDGSVALQNLDFVRLGQVEPHLLERVVRYAISRNVQQLGIWAQTDIDRLPPGIFSCHTLTSLKLSIYLKSGSPLFPKSLNLAALVSLQLQNFAFVASDNERAEPFSACKCLNTLLIDNCSLKDAQILCISNTTLANFSMRYCSSKSFYKIVLSTPNLRSFTFAGVPCQHLSGSNLSVLEQVNIDAETWSSSLESPLLLLCWLLDLELANVKSLTVSSSTLQALFLIPGLLKIKLPCLGNLKSLKVKVNVNPALPIPIRRFAKSQKAELNQSSPIPDGIVDFLLQNSPSAEVAIIKYSRIVDERLEANL